MQDRERIFRLCDEAAGALVLFDSGDASSVRELSLALAAVSKALGGSLPDGHPATALGRAARSLTKDPETDISYVDAAIEAVRVIASSSEESGDGSAQAVADAIAASSLSPAESIPALAGDEELLRDFAIRAIEYCDDVDECLLALEVDPTEREAVDTVFRAFHTIKGMAGFLALDDISRLAHDTEGLLDEARSEAKPVGETQLQSLFGAVDTMRQYILAATGIASSVTQTSEPEVHPAGSVVTSDLVGPPVPETAHASALAAAPAAQTAPKRAAGAKAPGGSPAGGNGSTNAGMVRVDEARLDALLDAIGELVIAESMVSAQARQGSGGAVTDVHIDRLDKITRELQHMATSLRMVSLKSTFRRMARLVRDLSRKSGKPVELITTGEETELDKTVVDRIQDPLIHALRNAIDHGLESPEQRSAAGKPVVGRIELKAYHAGGSIHVEVSDDGAGINVDRVLEKARAQGIVAADERPDDRTLHGLIFAPGFSTAERVTDVSGRGVGMDVVRRTVEELRGRVELQSQPGSGATLSIRLPVTLAIIDGMVVRVGGERYVVPVLSIERSVRPTADQLSTVKGKGLLLVTDDELIPIVKLHKLFNTSHAEPDPTEAVVTIVSEGGMRAGLLACELLGQQQTVIKPLGEGIPDQPGVAGGAIMPDGRVGLILDAAGLVRLANDRSGVRA